MYIDLKVFLTSITLSEMNDQLLNWVFSYATTFSLSTEAGKISLACNYITGINIRYKVTAQVISLKAVV